MRSNILFTFFFAFGALGAQTPASPPPATLDKILQRLDGIEKQNAQLVDEVHALRQELAALRATAPPSSDAATTKPPTEERLAVSESRIEEQSQSKVESAQKSPVVLYGTLLFNSFLNGGATNAQLASYSDLLAGPNSAGATLRQTLIGLRFSGPSIPGGGKVSGDLNMDFYSGGYLADAEWLRIRRGTISLDWANRSIVAGQEKPLLSPHEPNSLAEVGVPPLSGSGNLWLWLPQIRYEERMRFGLSSGLTAQVAVLQTKEDYAAVPYEYSDSLEKTRPALEGRVALWHKWDDTRRFEIAPGFHVSTTHVGGTSVPSRLFSVDWLAVPTQRLEFSGAFFHGRNFSNVGGLPTGFTFADSFRVTPIHGEGGWAQLSSPLSSRLTLNIFGGVQQNRERDLLSGDIARNFSYASNLMYRLSPNIIISLEAQQERTRLLQNGNLIRNHYDLAVAYLF